ncbi:MAG: hypothetical protein PHD05_01405 [Sphaerochaetaceae bacterium]|nr:hypothetical protein [Sphaerochaetaceae bacterium]
MSTYSRGIAAENKVKQGLQRKGWFVRQSSGSRGPYDLYAFKGGRKMMVQVKSGTARLTSEGRSSLRQVAHRKGATAVSMYVRNGRVSSRFV